ncbi:ATP-dependent zinc metalloprotease FtsH [Corynebacterium afermentans subsp. afermentans]|uniref:ATP-dependent zinc metalloprotease FtsH n=1 Tax=Corynebacterium afermentans TaxID=38286 RepID=A0A9X8WH67_9CORY|nr:ATP-dependent zinc metalloprotease FtsH [Corynebacterium afermentans]OAA15864.1 cell division protein FtsH [Corynebacterium afermentans subsp. afermentans]WJY57467.1 ATP-dependent zinc metalloprotease FtsH [Corynebacterium afermentans subsp. afermentans]SIQ10329.1 membrane protease FtsH catalytic subunit [Corynebacterium afermentans]
MSKNKKVLRWGIIGAIALIVLYLLTLIGDDSRAYQRVDTSVALEQLQNHNAEEVQIDDREQRVRIDLREPISVDEREGVEAVSAQYPARTTPEIFSAVRESGADKYETNVTQESFLMSMLGFMLPMILVFGLIFYFMYRMQAGGGGPFGIGGSKAKQLTKDNPTNTFADVAGADEAVDELHEVVDFLTDPTVYEELGAKIPRGVLLYGPPGTGKTLLARAVAGEAGVPFYTISGSDFVEMFVGVGASRVRDLFKQARENSPCIIFVDEIDAVGRQRGSGMGGGHDEREQTLNQLLVEMDGFSGREGVILIAATNRPDILDPALLRPGRFDRQIPVTNPDIAGRAQILKVHAKNKPLADDVSLDALAKRTAGMSGADLANVLNEAALLTARIGGNVITADALEEATDRVIGGPRRSSKVISEHEKKVTAYHEGGHTLAAWALKDIERVYKVTILARGRTGGFAMTADEDDKGMYTRDELFARMVFAMGGRSAEELVFGAPTTGASNDIEQATKIARAMVTEYGMTSTLGPVKYGQEQGDPFSGRGSGGSLEYSPAVAAKIDEEMQMLLHEAHKVAYTTLERYRDELDNLASKLLEKETLRRGDLEAIFDTVEPVRPPLPAHDARFGRQSDREPVKTPVEIAKERGEEPPKRFSILEASKATRERRRKEREAEQNPEPKKGSTRWQQPKPNEPQYGGPKPPEGWTYKGAPKQDQPQQHPGTRNYPTEKTEQIGFRLPENERPDAETAQLPREERAPKHRRDDD